MTPALRRSLFAVTALSALSALVFVWLRSFVPPVDEFSAYGHPAQPWALDLHVVGSAAFTLLLGVVIGAHVLPRWPAERRARASGGTLLLLASLMIASGALLPCCVGDFARTAAAWTHGLSGAAFTLAIPWHLVCARRATARGARALAGQAAQGAGWLRCAPTPRSRVSAAACQPRVRRWLSRIAATRRLRSSREAQ